jgi:hypothetical protein
MKKNIIKYILDPLFMALAFYFLIGGIKLIVEKQWEFGLFILTASMLINFIVIQVLDIIRANRLMKRNKKNVIEFPNGSRFTMDEDDNDKT